MAAITALELRVLKEEEARAAAELTASQVTAQAMMSKKVRWQFVVALGRHAQSKTGPTIGMAT